MPGLAHPNPILAGAQNAKLGVEEFQERVVGASRKAERLVGALEELGAGLGDLGLALIKAAKYEDEEGGRSGAYTLSASASKAIAAEAKRVGTARGPLMCTSALAHFRCVLPRMGAPARQTLRPRADERSRAAAAHCGTAHAHKRIGAHHMRAAPVGRGRARAPGPGRAHARAAAAQASLRLSRTARQATAQATARLAPLHDHLALSPVRLHAGPAAPGFD